MPIDKYLCDVQTPAFQPGPFSVRLKYDLKRIYFDAKRGTWHHFAYTAVIFGLFVLCLTFVMNPKSAESVNTYVFGASKDNPLESPKINPDDIPFINGNDIYVSNISTNIQYVNDEERATLPFLEEDKPYIIQKYRNHENKVLFYISELKQQQPKPRTYY